MFPNQHWRLAIVWRSGCWTGDGFPSRPARSERWGARGAAEPIVVYIYREVGLSEAAGSVGRHYAGLPASQLVGA